MKYLGYLAYALLFAATFGLGTASAKDFEPDVPTKVTNTILCDTSEAITEIMEAQQVSWGAATASYLKWNNIRSEEDDPHCYAPSAGGFVVVKAIAVVGRFENLHTPRGEMIGANLIAVMWHFSGNDWRPGFIVARVGVAENPEELGQAL